jgi:hypothetical protein
MKDLLSAEVRIIHVIFATDKTDLNMFWGTHHACTQYLPIVNFLKDICQTPTMGTWIFIAPISCQLEGAVMYYEVQYYTGSTVLSPLRNLDITRSHWNCTCADGF